MGTHRSTTTNQLVGLRITETCREASKVAQNEVGDEQNMVDFSNMPCGEKAVIFSLMVRAHDGPAAKKKNVKTSSPELHAEKSGDSSFPLSKKCAASRDVKFR